MKRILTAFLFVFVALSNGYGEPLQQAVDAAHQRANATANPVLFLRGDKLNSSSKKQQQLYALAQYLFNMFLYTRNEPLQNTGPLSLKYIGALDPLYQTDRPLSMEKAKEWFYSDESAIIYQYLEQFLKEAGIKPVLFNHRQIEKNFLRLQKTFFFQNRYPTYAKYTSVNSLSAIQQTDLQLLTSILHKANKQALNQVVVFEQKPELNIDNPRIHGRSTYTYRWVKDECEYSSYVIGKKLLQAQNTSALLRRSRIYMITARDKYAPQLKPANPNASRFQLANGQQSSQWQYHTAVLVLLPISQSSYEPIVLDNFLAGDSPISLDEWTRHFANRTYFQVIPFKINKVYDEAIVPVTQRKQQRVLAGGRWCTPHPIHK